MQSTGLIPWQFTSTNIENEILTRPLKQAPVLQEWTTTYSYCRIAILIIIMIFILLVFIFQSYVDTMKQYIKLQFSKSGMLPISAL